MGGDAVHEGQWDDNVKVGMSPVSNVKVKFNVFRRDQGTRRDTEQGANPNSFRRITHQIQLKDVRSSNSKCEGIQIGSRSR